MNNENKFNVDDFEALKIAVTIKCSKENLKALVDNLKSNKFIETSIYNLFSYDLDSLSEYLNDEYISITEKLKRKFSNTDKLIDIMVDLKESDNFECDIFK